MSNPLSPKQFKTLQKTWYKKLKKSGFVDVESSENLNKTRYSFPIIEDAKHEAPVSYVAKRDYYIMAEHFLNSYPFENDLEREIWKFHTHGIGYLESLKHFKANKIKISRTKLHLIIQRLTKVMRTNIHDF